MSASPKPSSSQPRALSLFARRHHTATLGAVLALAILVGWSARSASGDTEQITPTANVSFVSGDGPSGVAPVVVGFDAVDQDGCVRLNSGEHLRASIEGDGVLVLDAADRVDTDLFLAWNDEGRDYFANVPRRYLREWPRSKVAVAYRDIQELRFAGVGGEFRVCGFGVARGALLTSWPTGPVAGTAPRYSGTIGPDGCTTEDLRSASLEHTGGPSTVHIIGTATAEAKVRWIDSSGVVGHTIPAELFNAYEGRVSLTLGAPDRVATVEVAAPWDFAICGVASQ